MVVVGLVWGAVVECGVKPAGIVAELDVPGHVFAGVFPGRVDGAVDPFDFDGGVERFGLGVVPAYPGPPDGTPYAEFRCVVGEFLRQVLRAAVGTKPISA